MVLWIILLGILGLMLVFAEMLIPGFGVFGIIGSLVLLGTVTLCYKVYGEVAFLMALTILAAAFILLIVIAKKSGLYKRFVLKDRLETKDFDESTLDGLLGAEGLTQTTLRPFGVADFQGRSVDVCSKGEFIDKGKKIRVVDIKGKIVTVVVC